VYVVEDAAQAIESYFTFSDGKQKPLGSIGHLGCFSFHETKNIIAGEGGMLVVNDEKLQARAEIIWEKGTNRSAFFRGEVDKYGWKDIGSSFLPSELTAAFLYAQLENLEKIQARRRFIWKKYHIGLKLVADQMGLKSPEIPEYATNNAHMYYLICDSRGQREQLLAYLKGKNILAVFHYLSLHKSDFFKQKHDGRKLPMSDLYSNRLIRLPFYFELGVAQQNYVIKNINRFSEKGINQQKFQLA
jgi:dTDP-4-amino-4,6-dideoxygalactose transaminase